MTVPVTFAAPQAAPAGRRDFDRSAPERAGRFDSALAGASAHQSGRPGADRRAVDRPTTERATSQRPVADADTSKAPISRAQASKAQTSNASTSNASTSEAAATGTSTASEPAANETAAPASETVAAPAAASASGTPSLVPAQFAIPTDLAAAAAAFSTTDIPDSESAAADDAADGGGDDGAADGTGIGVTEGASGTAVGDPAATAESALATLPLGGAVSPSVMTSPAAPVSGAPAPAASMSAVGSASSPITAGSPLAGAASSALPAGPVDAASALTTPNATATTGLPLNASTLAAGVAAAVAGATTTGSAPRVTEAVPARDQPSLPGLAPTVAAQAPAPVSAAAPVAAAAPVQAPPLAAQVSGPLVRLASAANGEHVVTITVTPDNLGPVTVRAHVSGEGMRVELFAPNDAGRDALRSILSDLKRDLSGAGVSANLDLSGQNQPAPGDDGTRRTPNRGAHQNSQEISAQTAPAVQRQGLVPAGSTIDLLA